MEITDKGNNMYYKEMDLFGNEEIRIVTSKNNRVQTSFTDYDGFVEKFEPKKTTDDCYTPSEVYNTIVKYVCEQVDLTGHKIIRPFYPGGDYQSIEYSITDVVIDNPPFSIVSQIAKFYINRGVKFFIFAPHMTLFSSDLNCTCVVCGASIVYENGANVKTSFLSNLFGDKQVIATPELYAALKIINKNEIELPKYQYPNHVLTVSNVQKFVERGINFSVERKHIKHIRRLDDQTKHNKSLFGSGFLLSDKAAADKAAADKAAADKANIIEWKLSERELKIISDLG
jgi:hypothetical protein